MTDKEKNDSLKNQDKNFNENFTQEKEQIIIDGVDVSECEFYVHYDYGKFPHGCSLHKDMFGLPACCDVADCCKNCYFKQLQKEKFENLNNKQMVESAENLIYENSELIKNLEEKKQECEELKEEYTELKLENKELYRILADLKKVRKLKDRYRKTLEEIKEIVKINCEEICGRKLEDCNDFLCPSKNIIDIINKAKDTTNET